MKKKRTLYLLDIFPLLYRAHFATVGKRFATTTGISTGTSLVFFNYIFQVLLEQKPDAVAAVVDTKEAIRTETYSDYKANREVMPEEIGGAFPHAMRLMESLGIEVFKKEGYEADDVIATLTTKAVKLGYEVYIVSPDKDLAQLVSDKVFLYRPAYKGAFLEILDVPGVKDKFGVSPSQIADFLALKGDPVDNIPGVRGIGDKTAASLLAEYGSVEGLLENIQSVKQEKIRQSIISSREALIESKRLTTLMCDVELTVDWEALHEQRPDEKKLFALLDELQFVKIKERLVQQKFAGRPKPASLDSPAMIIKVRTISPDDALKLLAKNGESAIAYNSSSPRTIWLFTGGTKEIAEVKAKDDNSWQQLLAAIDEARGLKIGWDLKPLFRSYAEHRIPAKGKWIDLQLAAYLVDADSKIEWSLIQSKYDLPVYHVPAPYESLSSLPSLIAAYGKLSEKVRECEVSDLLLSIEIPLERVLARMEYYGITIDKDALDKIGSDLSEQLIRLEADLHRLAGHPFNVNSPNQTAEVLTSILDPSELRKTRTGQVSTAEPFLIDLAGKYEFVDALLKYRKLNKIITTYVQALPRFINEKTGRVHPVFHQVVAGTGRLSCSDPNLQNLPIKTDTGREVRKAIVPSGKGRCILSVDYNQVELRLLAALSGDEAMTESFRQGKDIHTTTSCKVFGISEAEMTKTIRNKAKEINFGIAYGMTPWGLASRLKISQKEAKEIIDAYFEGFPSVKQYLDQTIEETRGKGYTRTQFGRIRYIEGINSRNGTTRKMAERMAVNAPIQGLAADIIKAAMVAVDNYITAHKLKTQMVLQVHDELVFDACEEELDEFIPALVKIMEAQGNLSVPVKVNVSKGPNWMELEEVKMK